MSIPIPCLDGLLLASAAYPSGFSYSLFTQRRGPQPEVSTSFLAFMTLPYAVVGAVTYALRPERIALHGTSALLLALALLLAPVALGIEYVIHSLASYRPGSPLFRSVSVQSFWNRLLTPGERLLFGLVVLGEEIFYRGLWFGTLERFGLPLALALGISSLAYGLNHLSFGATSVLSKTVSGCLYGALYALGGRNLLLPLVAHCLQNLVLFQIGKDRHA